MHKLLATVAAVAAIETQAAVAAIAAVRETETAWRRCANESFGVQRSGVMTTPAWASASWAYTRPWCHHMWPEFARLTFACCS